MEGDPTGVAATPAAADTTADPTTALAASEPTAAGSSAVEDQHDESAETAAPTPDSDESAEVSGENEGTESEDDQPRNDEERKLSRRERQRLREQERIDKAIADALAAKEREREQAEEIRKREEAAAAALKARAERVAQYVGTPEAFQTLNNEIDQLNTQIRRELVEPTIGTDLDALVEQVNQKTAQRDRWKENQGFEAEIQAEVWSQIESGFAAPAQLVPELAADPKARMAYLHAEGGIPGALTILADTVRAATNAKRDAEIAEIKKRAASELAAMRADRDGWRSRAGGGGDSIPDAGEPSHGSGVLTPERYAAMDSSQRAKLRSTPEGRAQIDAMTRRASGAA